MHRLRDLIPIWRLERILHDRKVAREQRVDSLFIERLILKTDDFATLTWLGRPIGQSILDLWTIQETIVALSPALLVETGTNRGGSAYFYASLFDLMHRGEVLTIDIRKAHNLVHPRIEFLIGSSVSEDVAAKARERASDAAGPVMVILDSDHSENHVFRELELYAPLVTPGSFILVQDGIIDTLHLFRRSRPGPLPAIKRFLEEHPEFEMDTERCERFLVTHHPLGWLRRKR